MRMDENILQFSFLENWEIILFNPPLGKGEIGEFSEDPIALTLERGYEI